MSETKGFHWQTDAFDIEFIQDDAGVICIRQMLPKGSDQRKNSTPPLFPSSVVPLVSVKLTGEGKIDNKTSKTLIGGALSARLKYQSHETAQDGAVQEISIKSSDDKTGILVTTNLVVYSSIPVVRSSVTITNTSASSSIVVTQLSSFTIGGMTGSHQWFDEYTAMSATNSWFREAMWHEHTLPELGIDNDGICELKSGHTASQASFSLSNRGSFSTGTYLPMGLLKSKDHGDTWLWQVEHNGSWRWEIGDYKDDVYLAAGGPTGPDHDWKHRLNAGESFTTVPVAIAHVYGDYEEAFAALNDYRRAILRPHQDNEKLPIIFNDYMNCLMGDPDEHKIQALLDPVAKSGAEYFVIDAGWYADDGDWWDDVGLWEPSKKRFPSGFKTLIDKIKAKGLIAGLWLEPEVVGVRSVVASTLPREAFFHEFGELVVEKGRYQLDYRHSSVRDWMNTVVDRLIHDYGVGYFKFDYNIEVIQGTDVGSASSTGSAHLEHQRCYLAWVGALMDRHPGLVIESCSSGAQRLDYAMLSIHPLQSTSDQQDPALYAAISAACPTAVLPEQSASWAYPQPEWSYELTALTVINSMLRRVYLSGRLDKLNSWQMDLVTEGMNLYKTIRQDLRTARATWPLGLPKWHDDWVSLGMVTKTNGLYLAVWRRSGETGMQILLPAYEKSGWRKAKILYPSSFLVDYAFEDGALAVRMPEKVCACIFHIT
jgi:alpha-galactosidase